VLILLEKSLLLIQNIKRKSNKPAKFNNEDFKGGSVTFFFLWRHIGWHKSLMFCSATLAGCKEQFSVLECFVVDKARGRPNHLLYVSYGSY